MSYEPTNWKSGDKVTSTRLNKIEQGIQGNDEEISNIKEDLNAMQSVEWSEGYVNGRGVITSGAGRFYSNLLICPPNTQVSYVAETNHSNIMGISFYDSSGTLISGYFNNGAIGTEITVTSPEYCAFCRLSTNATYKDRSYYKTSNCLEYLARGASPLTQNEYLTFVTSGSTRAANYNIDNILTASIEDDDYQIALYYRRDGVERSTPWARKVVFSSVNGVPYYLNLRKADDTAMPSAILDRVVKVTRPTDAVLRRDLLEKCYVNKNGSDSNDGTSRAKALLTIQAAIDKGAKTIVVGEGVYSESLTLTDVCGLHISLDMSGNNYSATDNPDNPKVVIDGGSSVSSGVVMSNCYDCTFENIELANFTGSAWVLNDCSGITFTDCVIHDIAVGQQSGGGFVLTDTNADFYNCVAYNIGTTIKGTGAYHIDGFNIHNTGTVNLFNCSAWNCEDDGVSHHDACCGVIDGGEWSNCGKGGVASPTHGAKVDVRNVYCHDNNYAGIYADSDHVFADRGKTIFSNCVCKDNLYDMVIGDDYDVIAINCVYDTVRGSANITRFGIT